MTIGASSIISDPHYGNIFSYRPDPRAELPSIGRFLSQGAVMGALLGFVWPIVGILAHPENGYNYLLVGYLPVFLAAGMLFGLCLGIPIWAVTFLVGHRLHLAVRAVIGAAMLPLLIVAYAAIFFEPSPYREELSITDSLLTIGIYAGCGLLCGLVIGSRFQPVRELIRGTKSEQWPVMNALTGFALRIIVLFALMFSALVLLLAFLPKFDRQDFMDAIFVFGPFAGAAIILFVRMPFWLLLPLALIVNFPLAVLVPYEAGDIAGPTLRLNYFALWAAFLLCRWSVPRVFTRREQR
jgi:hypothetical protein